MTNPKRLFRFWVLALILVTLPPLGSLGCRGSGQVVDGDTGTGPGTGTTEGITGAEATSGGALLWVWPPPPRAGGTGPTPPADLNDPPAAYFRFAGVPAPGSLKVSVNPSVPHDVYYTGNVVMVVPDKPEPGTVYDVAVNDSATGTLLGRASVTATEQPGHPPQVLIAEVRDISIRLGGTGVAVRSVTGPSFPPLTDGAIVTVSFGTVIVNVRAPSQVSEEAFRSAVVLKPPFEPPRQAMYAPDPEGGTQMWAEWPGVESSASFPDIAAFNYGNAQFPNPQAIAESGQAPKGFALEMTVTVDAAKLPPATGFAALTGEDGHLRIRIVRKTAARYTVACGENLHGPEVAAPSSGASTILPYPGYRDQWSLRPEPHALVFTFSKPMDRGSVERSIVGRASAPGSLVWTFDWRSDRVVEVRVSPAQGASSGPGSASMELLSNPVAVDAEGLPLWFDDTLWLRWSEAVELARVPAVAPEGKETGGDTSRPWIHASRIPTGAEVVDVSEGGPYDYALVALEPCREPQGIAPARYVTWVGLSGVSREWVDLSGKVRPCLRAQLVDATHVFLDRHDGWDIVDVGGSRDADGITSVNLNVECRWLGLLPSPDGETVAAFRSDWPTSEEGWQEDTLVGLVLYDLEGREMAETGGVTWVNPRNGSPYSRIPAAWLPDGKGLVFVDRMAQPAATRLMRLDIPDGSPASPVPIPGTEGATLSQEDTLAAFEYVVPGQGGSAAVLACSLFDAPDAGPARFRLIDLATGKDLFAARAGENGLPESIQRCLPSPNGRFVAVSGDDRTVVLDVDALWAGSDGPAPGSQVICSTHEGTVVDWSADSLWLYVNRPGGWSP